MIQAPCYFSWILLSAHTFRFKKKIQRTLKCVNIITQDLRGPGSVGEVDSTEQYPKGRMSTFSNAPVICKHAPTPPPHTHLELRNGGG